MLFRCPREIVEGKKADLCASEKKRLVPTCAGKITGITRSSIDGFDINPPISFFFDARFSIPAIIRFLFIQSRLLSWDLMRAPGYPAPMRRVQYACQESSKCCSVEQSAMSLCLEVVILAILTELGWALLYGVMEYVDKSLTLIVCWIIKVWSEYRIGRIFSVPNPPDKLQYWEIAQPSLILSCFDRKVKVFDTRFKFYLLGRDLFKHSDS